MAENGNGLPDDRYIGEWLANVGETSRRIYLGVMSKFLGWCEKTPEELIQMRMRELEEMDPLERNGIKALLLGYRKQLESEGYSPKTIARADGVLRGFFSHIIGLAGSINIPNYEGKDIVQSRDFVPTLEELTRLLEPADIADKFRMLFLAQSGLRPSDAVRIRYGDVRRELELGRDPIAIHYLPLKDRNKNIGERISFVGTDCIQAMKQYIRLANPSDENTLLGVGQARLNEIINELAKISQIDRDSPDKIRLYSMRKFMITTLTNRGVSDKIIDFLTGHAISSVDETYWKRRVDELREIYNGLQQHLNPSALNGQKANSRLEQSQLDIAYQILDIITKTNPEPARRVLREISEARLDIKYDPKVEIRPAFYIVQEASRRLLDEMGE